MSFLPYAAPSPGAWLGSLGFSAVAHAGMASVIFLSGSVALLPEVDQLELEEETVAVSLQILDADLIDEPDIPEDAVPVTPDTPDVDTIDEETAVDTDVLEPDTPEETATEAEPDPIIQTEPEAVVENPLETGPDAPVTEVETENPTEVITSDAPETEVETPPVDADPIEAPEPVAAPEPQTPPVAAAPIIEEPVINEPVITEPIIEPGIVNPINGTGAGSGVARAPGEDDLITIGESEPTQDPPVQVIESEPIDQIAGLPGPSEPIDTTPDPVEPQDPDAPDTVGPDDGEIQTGTVVEEGPATTRPALQNPTAQDIAIGNLIRRIRALPAEACTLALPRRIAGSSEAGLALFGDDNETLNTLASEIVVGTTLQAVDPAPVQSRDIIDPRQCAALDAIRQSTDYPVSRIGLSLDSATLTSGDTLTARVLGAGGLFLTLLVVDDNGVVQDLAPFTRLDGDTPVIEVPVARAGPTRTTRQLLLALGTAETPLNLQGLIGERAQDVFTRIPPEQLETLVFSVVSFDVR